jgi:hypothetical protein
MVAHLWAHQSQNNARNASSSTSFEGAVFYSYQTPVAMLHETKGGRRVALITSDGYSMTTKSKHLNAVWRALHDVSLAFRVPYVGAYGGMAPRDPLAAERERLQWKENLTFSMANNLAAQNVPDMHALNVAYLVEEYRKLCGTLKRMQSHYYADANAVAARLESEATIVRGYCQAFGLDVPALDPSDDARVIWRTHEIRAERDNDPAVIAKRAKERETRDARKAKKEARERFERFVLETEHRARFRSGGYAYGVCDEHGGALLRYDAADDMVRTSLGAEIPAEHARKAFPLIARIKETGLFNWMPEGRRVHLGAFELNEITSSGTIRAGCHTIHWPEIEACARALGLVS